MYLGVWQSKVFGVEVHLGWIHVAYHSIFKLHGLFGKPS